MTAQTHLNPVDQGHDHFRVLENDVPMQGAGFYNAHSALQAAAMRRALPLFDTIPVSNVSERFTAVEYGCAQGANSSVYLIYTFYTCSL
jgi:hypothetical protein